MSAIHNPQHVNASKLPPGYRFTYVGEMLNPSAMWWLQSSECWVPVMDYCISNRIPDLLTCCVLETEDKEVL